MPQENKDLLWKELCARLPYNIKVQDTYYTSLKPITPYLIDVIRQEVKLYADENWQSIENIKLYLRPLSDMTDEERKELSNGEAEVVFDAAINGKPGYNTDTCVYHAFMINWMNKHHFDYQGLIPKNIALPAERGMYNIK